MAVLCHVRGHFLLFPWTWEESLKLGGNAESSLRTDSHIGVPVDVPLKEMRKLGWEFPRS